MVKVSNAVGVVFEPTRVRRLAQAKADAALIAAESKIAVSDRTRRAAERWVAEETKKQENIESITDQSFPYLHEEADASKMKDDWVTNFFDKCCIVSDKDMQNILAKILAGEANAPASFSKRTVNIVNTLDKEDLEIFQCLLSFLVSDYLLVFDINAEIYTSNKVNFHNVRQLESIGLVHFDNLMGLNLANLGSEVKVTYNGTEIILALDKEADKKLPIGSVALTQAGLELSKVCEGKPVDGFPEYLKERWKKYLVT